MRLIIPALTKPDQRGDTIVEVLIAIAIVSTILFSAYETVSRNTRTTQDTQEHSQALQLAQAQLEYLRTAASLPAAGGCFNGTGAPVSGGNCLLDSTGAVDTSHTQPEFTVGITSSGSSPATYKVLITWASLSGAGATNSVSLYYQR